MQYAKFGQRIHAAAIDLAIMIAISAVVFLVAKDRIQNAMLTATNEDERQATGLAVIAVMMFVTLMADLMYFVMLPARTRCTIGHYVLKLRMTMGDGTPATLNAIALKHCFSLILLAILLFGIWSIALLPSTQELHLFVHHTIIAVYGWALINLFVMGSNSQHRTLADYIADIAILDKDSVKPDYVIYYKEIAQKEAEELEEKAKAQASKKQAEEKDAQDNKDEKDNPKK